MSVFYNLTSANKDGELDKQLLFDERAFQPILDNQSKYMVGIHRFKLPTEGVDFFRLYPNRAIIGAQFPADDLQNSSPYKQSVLVDLFTNGGGVTANNFYYDTEEQLGYIPVRDNHEFCSYLNRALMKSFMEGVQHQQEGTGNYGPITSFTSPLDFTNSQTNTPITVAVQPPYATGTLFDYTIDIQTITQIVPAVTGANIGDPNADRLLSTLSFSLYVSSDVTTFKPIYVPILKNCWADLKIGDFTKVFPLGIKVSATEGVSQTLLPELIRKYRNSGCPFQPIVFSPLSTDLDLVILRHFVKGATPTTGTQFNFNVSYNGLGFDSGAPTKGPKIGITGSLSTMMSSETYFDDDGLKINEQIGIGYSDIGSAPLFSFSDDTQRLTLSIPPSFLAQRSFNIYNNIGLRNYMGFRSSPTLLGKELTGWVKWDGTNNGPTLGNTENGVYMDLTPSLSSAGEYVMNIEEQQKSVFKRNFLSGLQIVANNLSNASEFEGNGKKTRKILSDFLIDPSTDFRQYMIYEPQGAIRYYPLLSTEPLRELVISVFYVDTNGNTHPLFIEMNYQASIKLEFKPVNQIENFLMDGH